MSSNEEQLYFINHDIDDMSLIGIPGGGKTRTIIEKIFTMKQKKQIDKPSDFLILTFSRKARIDFLNKGQNKCNKLFKLDNIRTIHSVSALILKKIFGKSCKNINTLIAGVSHQLHSNTIENLDKVSCLKKCKCIFVDEAQDISNIQYNLIKQVASILDIKVIMIGDPDQNIYQFQGGSDKYLLEHSDNKVILDKNYRSTKNIIRFANNFRPWKDMKPIVAIRETLGKLPYIYCDNIANIKSYILKEIRETKIKLEDIAIIGPVKKAKPNLFGHYKNMGLQMVAGILDDNDIKYIPHYNFSDNDTMKNKGDSIKGNHINLLTIHGSKGLEFKKVILLNFHKATMGRLPSQTKYNEFKYLWYVGITRAMDELSIFLEHNKPAWTELKEVDSSYYKLIGKEPMYNDNLSEEDKEPSMYGVTDLFEHNLFTEEKEFELETMLNLTVSEDRLFNKPCDIIHEHDKYSSLYGSFIENIFTYYGGGRTRLIDMFIARTKKYILVSKEYYDIYKKLKQKINPLTLDNIESKKNKLNNSEIRLYNILKQKIDYTSINKQKPITLIKDNGVSVIDESYVKQLCIDITTNPIKSIFNLTVYFYQIEYECKSILNKNFDENIKSLKPYIDCVKQLAENTYIEKYQGGIEHPNLPMKGVYDAITDDSIIDFKFTMSYSYKHALQLVMYYNMMEPYWNKKKKLEIWNLYQGIKYSIVIDENLNNYQLNSFLCNTFNMKMKNMIYVYDLETTGLYQGCDIIERCFIEYNYKDIVSHGLIKPKYPVSPLISSLTGISNEMLKDADDDLTIFKNDIKNILQVSQDPIFIAHNGDKFDHQVLIDQCILPKNSILLDSKNIISASAYHKTYNMKLYEIYELIVGKSKGNIHRAKADTEMVIEILEKMNINLLNYKHNLTLQ